MCVCLQTRGRVDTVALDRAPFTLELGHVVKTMGCPACLHYAAVMTICYLDCYLILQPNLIVLSSGRFALGDVRVSVRVGTHMCVRCV